MLLNDNGGWRWSHWLLALAAPLLATLVCWFFSDLLPAASLALFYLAAVLLTAVSTAIRPALLSAVVSFLSYNFFFTAPHFTLFILHREDILTASLLILVALVTGQLAAGLREKVDALQSSERWTKQQMMLAQSLASCVQAGELIDIFLQEVQALFRPDLLAPDTQSVVHTRPSNERNDVKKGSLSSHWNNHCFHIVLCDNDQHLHEIQLPLKAPVNAWLKTRIEATAEILRLAWSRVLLVENLQQETVIKEREQLRSALLSSISHDLRTPLATMIGSVSSLCDLRPSLSEAQQDELLKNTLSEARRLDRYIQKLLDMTKIGQGELKLERDWAGIDDILSVSLKRLQPLLDGQQIITHIDPELPLLYVHAALLEQATFNVLENAVRYTPAGKNIQINAHASGNRLLIDIADSGPGIPPEHWPHIFDMFFTLAKGDQQTGGTGLGLTICQGILAAHGGSANILYSSAEQGTCFRLSLPVDNAVPGNNAEPMDNTNRGTL